ncbi:MAG TPA: GNAT family N-acetyltransferase [Isosphaeraceae bacterium]|nr:GNAT family N-acetyltransferase [Isosphaeraceae bacterium]
MPKPILETPRLALREMTRDDLDFVAAMLADPEVMRYYPRCYDRDEAAEWIDRQLGRYRSHGRGLWLVGDRETGELVGQVGLIPPRLEDVPEDEIGYLIHRPFWRRGLASEAASGVRDHAFGTLGRARVVSLIRPENVPSQGVALRIGMMREPGRLVEQAGFAHWVFAAHRRVRYCGPSSGLGLPDGPQ